MLLPLILFRYCMLFILVICELCFKLLLYDPLLEYNLPVWSPYLKKDIALIESIQKRFTHVTCVHCNISFDS